MRRFAPKPTFAISVPTCSVGWQLAIRSTPQVHELGPSLVLKLVGECGTDLSPWPDAKHFTSWLCLPPSNKISGWEAPSSRTRRSGSRGAALRPLAAVTVGRTQTALGAF